MNDLTSRASTRKTPDRRQRTPRARRHKNKLKQTPFSERLGTNDSPFQRRAPMKTEDAKDLIDRQLENLSQALDSGQSEQMSLFLSTMAKFHRYSLGNVLLIMCQAPHATHVAGFHTWKSLGRFVKSGEKGIAILAPMLLKTQDDSPGSCPESASFSDARPKSGDQAEEERHLRFRVVYVFDVTQTDGEALPEFAKVSGDPGDFAERLKGLVKQLSIELQYQEDLGGAMGSSSGGVIKLKAGLDPAQEFQVLAHELAHEILHHGEGRAGSTKTSRELEAEAVAFVVSQAVGLDCATASADYIQLYNGDRDRLTQSLDSIRKAAGAILEALA